MTSNKTDDEYSSETGKEGNDKADVGDNNEYNDEDDRAGGRG